MSCYKESSDSYEHELHKEESTCLRTIDQNGRKILPTRPAALRIHAAARLRKSLLVLQNAASQVFLHARAASRRAVVHHGPYATANPVVIRVLHQ